MLDKQIKPIANELAYKFDNRKYQVWINIKNQIWIQLWNQIWSRAISDVFDQIKINIKFEKE